MVRAIIFDCFGVLVRDGWLPYKERYFGNNPALWREAGEQSRMVNAGLLAYGDFLQSVATTAGIGVSQARREIEVNPPNERLFEWIRDDLKPHYKIGMLSNAGANWLGDLFEPWQVALFDEVVLSYEIGVTKPEPAAYQAITDRIGVEAGECVFVDDQSYYCDAARAFGMEAIVYEDNLSFKERIQKYNIHLGTSV